MDPQSLISKERNFGCAEMNSKMVRKIKIKGVKMILKGQNKLRLVPLLVNFEDGEDSKRCLLQNVL